MAIRLSNRQTYPHVIFLTPFFDPFFFGRELIGIVGISVWLCDFYREAFAYRFGVVFDGREAHVFSMVFQARDCRLLSS